MASGRRFAFLRDLPGVTASQAALAYVLADANVAAAVVGATRMAHLLENLATSGMTLDAATLDRIRTAQESLR